MEEYSKVSEMVPEKVIRLTKHIWRCSFDSFPVEFLTEVFRVFIKMYQEVPISSFVYAAEVGSTVFYKYPAYRELLQQAFEKICEITFQHLPKFADLEEYPELTEDFFGVLVRYGRYTPDLLVKSENLKSTILELSMMAIGIEHKLVAKSLYAWLEVLCKLLWKNVQDQVFKQSLTEEQRKGKGGWDTSY